MNYEIYSFDFDIDPITLLHKLDLNIIKMHVCTENDVISLSSSKRINMKRYIDTQKDIQTDTHTGTKTDRLD